jgi:aldehyde dehydrogenase (NAD+)
MWHGEQLLIDGKLVDAEDGRSYSTLDPSTGDELGTCADATLADGERAITAARAAFDAGTWFADRDLRVRCLRQLYDAMIEHQEDLRQLVIVESGNPLMLTQGPGLDTPLEMIPWYADLLERYEFTEDLGTAEVRGAPHRRWVEKEPLGVVSAIVPYNYPIQISLAKLVPALAAGCTVVLKSPPQTPWITASLARIIAEHTDIPPGVVNILTTEGSEIGHLMASHPGIDMVSVTSSTATGRAVMAAASTTVKKVFLELGGKSAFIMLDNADVDLASMLAAFTVCSHAGQGCAITTRLLVPEAKLAETVERVSGMLAGVPYGDPRDPGNMMGPLISEQQRDKVDAYVQGAVADGARVVCGGRRPDHLPNGYYYEPTLLEGVDPMAPIAQDEIFGPVLVALPYRDDADAVALANNTIFGLSATVIGEDVERATRVARGVRSGTVSINGGMWYAPDAPFGGFKQSGMGREMGVEGLEEYLGLKTLAAPA